MKYVKTLAGLVLMGLNVEAADFDADLVIYGSSPAAVSAAVKATDMGLKPIIVSPAQHVGGLSVSGLGFTDSGNTAAIGGLAREFYRRIYQAYQRPEAWRWQRREEFKADGQGTKAMNHEEGTMWTFEPHVAEQVFAEWMAERKVAVHRGEFLDRDKGVSMKNGKIASIRTLSGNVYAGKYFIDATYEGDLMAAAGVPYRVGREDCAEFGERWNGNQVGVLHHGHHFRDWKISPYKVPGDPSSGLCAEIGTDGPGQRGKGDRRVQAYCYRVCMTDDPRNRIPFAKPDGYDPRRYELLGRCYAKGYNETFWKFDRIANHKTDTNNHGPLNADWLGGSYEWPEASYARRAELARAHRDYQMGLYYYLSSDPSVPETVRTAMSKWGLAKDEFVDNGGWPYEIYVREGRRMVGAYTMTEHDCLGEPRHPAQGTAYGPVGMGSYSIDSHNVRRYVTAEGWVQNEGDIEVRPKKPYGIDYGAIVPRKSDCANLLVPVAVSATHTAFGSIRMEPVFMLLGESAATAAAFAARDGRAVQDVDYSELAKRLRADGQILTLTDVGAGVDPARLEWFKDQKLALMMHFGLYSEVGIIESWPLSDADAYWSRAEVERDVATNGFKEAYFALNKSFNPVRFRPDEWAEEAVRGGFKYVIFTTKHHDGFCLYDSKYTDYKTTDPSCPFSAHPNADIVKAYFDACRRRGLGIGAYFSKPDWHHDDFWENRGIGRFTCRNATYDKSKDPERWARFISFFRGQVLELIGGYGPIDILWMDGGWIDMDKEMGSIIAEARKIQPGLIAVDRARKASGCEDVKTPEQFVPGKTSEEAWESCVTMAENWGYHYDDFYKSPRQLIHMLIDVVAKGGNLALNVGPMPDGRLPRPAVERMRAMGAWLAKFGKAIYATRPVAPYRKDDWAFTKGKDGTRYAIRLWAENPPASTMFISRDPALKGLKAVKVPATGEVLPVRTIENPALGQYGVAFELPAGFLRDEYADAFELVGEY